ncbi:MAG: hypothetical protein M0Q91_09770 [Methanoregula sp.]|jgi:hypothetical protein|nr:hypothetical protein [Methanoregula sp.]
MDEREQNIVFKLPENWIHFIRDYENFSTSNVFVADVFNKHGKLAFQFYIQQILTTFKQTAETKQLYDDLIEKYNLEEFS